MYAAVEVISLQRKSTFTVAGGEVRNSTVAERIVIKGVWDISWLKNSQVVAPLPNQPNLFLILRVIYAFVTPKSNHGFLHNTYNFY